MNQRAVAASNFSSPLVIKKTLAERRGKETASRCTQWVEKMHVTRALSLGLFGDVNFQRRNTYPRQRVKETVHLVFRTSIPPVVGEA